MKPPSIIRWTERARRAIPLLFRSLQEIDIHVEDANDHVFYTELFKRLAPSPTKIARVFTEGNKAAVLDAARRHTDGRPALFVIDGDFDWVRGEEVPPLHRLHRLPAYCVENLLIHEEAAVELLVEEAVVSPEEARTAFSYSDWLVSLEPLVDLGVWFAILNQVAPEEPTVGLGLNRILTSTSGCIPSLDNSKVTALIAVIEAKVVSIIGAEAASSLYSVITERTKTLPVALDVVSGKEFVLPLFVFRINACSKTLRINRRSLRVRLARHCDKNRFQDTTEAISKALSQ